MQVSPSSGTAIDGQWAVLQPGAELLSFTAGKPGASAFWFQQPDVLVDYATNFIANVEAGNYITSFFMNSVAQMNNVSTVPLPCYNRNNELYCERDDRNQLYYCNIIGNGGVVLAPSTWDNGLCHPMTFNIVSA